MSSIFDPSGNLNVSWDASDLPGEAAENAEKSGAMVRCKNLRIDQRGKATTRDGSSKINVSAINTDIYWIDEMEGSRFVFAGTDIYEDEASLTSDMTSAQWATLQYNAFNDSTKQIFALNGTDRVRIVSGSQNEWGIDAPTVAPELTTGGGTGLTGVYNARYTYVRKVGTAIVSESNPSPAATTGLDLVNQSLSVQMTDATDTQVTHMRVYRTLANGEIYYLEAEVPSGRLYTHGYAHAWETDDAYIAGDGYKFTITDNTHNTENTYTWEERFDEALVETDETPYFNGDTIPFFEMEDEYIYRGFGPPRLSKR